jgi:hypothetical protein
MDKNLVIINCLLFSIFVWLFARIFNYFPSYELRAVYCVEWTEPVDPCVRAVNKRFDWKVLELKTDSARWSKRCCSVSSIPQKYQSKLTARDVCTRSVTSLSILHEKLNVFFFSFYSKFFFASYCLLAAIYNFLCKLWKWRNSMRCTLI